MNNSLPMSDSLVGSLCREIEYIRQRHKIIRNYLNITQNKILKERLDNEIDQLKSRHEELLAISRTFKSQISSNISSLFLYELCNRPLL